MNFDDYCSEVYNDSMDVIRDSYKDYDNWEDLYDELFLCVTGNDNGSHYCNSAKAEEALEGVLWDSDYAAEYGSLPTDKGPEVCDVIVRINALEGMGSNLEEEFELLKKQAEGNDIIKAAIDVLEEEGMNGSWWDEDSKYAFICRKNDNINIVNVSFNARFDEYVVISSKNGDRETIWFCGEEYDIPDIVNAVLGMIEQE